MINNESIKDMAELKWIGLRPARRAEINAVETAEVNAYGLDGDRYDTYYGNRTVTLFREEGLRDAWEKLGKSGVPDPSCTRRNLMVSGLGPELKKMKGDLIRIGADVLLEVTGYCNPCSRMDETFGPGGLKAMAGHGGLTAKVIQTGRIRTGDEVEVTKAAPEGN